MSFSLDLPQFLLAQSAITSIVSTRIYPEALDPNDVYPALVLVIVSDIPVESHDGDSNLSFAHVQFSCYAKTPAQADSIREALKTLLKNFRGTLSPGTAVVGNVRGLNARGEYESATRIYHRILELEFEYNT